MTAERILQSDVLDILFENRNKQYGAYDLRRTYPHRIKRALAGMLLVIVVISVCYYLGFESYSQKLVNPSFDDSAILTDLTPPPEKPEEPVQPKPPAQPDVATVRDFIPVIKPDEMVPETEVPPAEQVDTSAYGDKTQNGVAAAPNQNVSSGEPGTPGGEGNSNTPATPEPVMPAGPIDMHQADEIPEYPGGTQALVRYMVNNLTSELEPGMKYIIKAQFVIDETGQVSEAAILSSDDASLNSQVLKALRKMKQWKPGKFRGRNVAVRFTMPVTFVGPEE